MHLANSSIDAGLAYCRWLSNKNLGKQLDA